LKYTTGAHSKQLSPLFDKGMTKKKLLTQNATKRTAQQMQGNHRNGT